MGFIESIPGKVGHLVEDFFRFLFREAIGFGPVEKPLFLLGHLIVLFLPHGPAEQIGLP